MSGLLSDPDAAEDERRRALQGLLGPSIPEELRQEQPDAIDRLYASLPPLPVRDGQSPTMPTDSFAPAPPRHDDEPLRSFGLGTRNVIEGLLGPPTAPADAATYPTNLLDDAMRPAQTPEELAAGRQRQPLFRPQAQAVGEILDWLGLPRAEAAQERIAGRVVQDLAGAVTGYVPPASVPPPQPFPSEVKPVLPPPEPGRDDVFGLDRPPDPFAVPPVAATPMAPLMPEMAAPPPPAGPVDGWSNAQSLASMAANPDAAVASGGDPGASAIHHIAFGRAAGRSTAPGIPPSPGPADLSTTPAGPDFPPGALLTADGSLLVPAPMAEGDPNLHLAAGPLAPAIMGLLNSGAVVLGGLLWQRYRSQDGGPVQLPQPIAPMPELPPLITPAPEPTRPPIESLTPPAAPDMSTLITPLPDAEVAWTDPGFTPIDQDPAQIFERNILAGKMREAGIEIPAKWEAHHIVPLNDGRFPEAVRARERLAELDIGINDEVNGVALPGSYHRGIHTRAYYQELAARLELIHSQGEARAYLREVAGALSRAIPAPKDQPRKQKGGG